MEAGELLVIRLAEVELIEKGDDVALARHRGQRAAARGLVETVVAPRAVARQQRLGEGLDGLVAQGGGRRPPVVGHTRRQSWWSRARARER